MNFYILVLVLFLTACQNDDRNPNISYTTLPKTAEIGFPINHNIMINNLGELFTLDSVVWQDSSAWLADSSKIFIKDSKIDTLDSSVSIDYQITFWDTGKVVIPPLYVFISFPDSLEASILKTDSSFVFISTVLDTTMTTVLGDKPYKEIQFPIERLKLFSAFLLCLLVMFVLMLISSRNDKKFSKRKFFNFNPKTKALSELKKINASTNSEEFFFQISEILRKYFQDNFYIISFEMTSAELKDYFEDDDLSRLLDEIDQVKFAKNDPNSSDKKNILELFKKVIRKLL